uniref:UbiX family flavin prenyltransferase n=1 Tax=Pararhizobium sp. IMCC3301 TaxID=3067904 RepID=UPI002741E207|nr:UbiX family flavin prenyltransferase [Pararhizobium sp. IMCC3301]
MSAPQRVVLGVSGASGAAIAMRIAERLRALEGVETHLVISGAAQRTLAHEIGPDATDRLHKLADHVHAIDDIGANIASGSFRSAGMIIAPCSMRSLGAIATSLSDNLLVRAADVHLKERRRLVLLARESPLHLGHLRLMCAVTEMGAIIAPPVPAFYLKPATIAQIIDQIAARAIDLLALDGPNQAEAWQGESGH